MGELIELAKSTQGGVAAALLFSCAAFGGSHTKEFMPPFDYWASFGCTVALYVGLVFLFVCAVKSQLKRKSPISAEHSP